VPYLNLNASVSGALLNFLGQDVIVSGRAVSSPQVSLLIERGCDAIHPSALFVSAVVAFPVALRAKLLGAAGGVALLMIANLIRIISLFYIKIHFPRAFDMMHVEVWQALFIFVAVLLWLLWAAWAERKRSAKADVPP
jgi:exosortase/archaeosortase family protein